MYEKDIKLTRKLCKELKEKYDANILKKYPQYLQDLFFETSKNSNTTLSTLVNNLAKSGPEHKFISGPTECKKYVKNNTTIYIFGENDHSDKGGCFNYANTKPNISITKYLEELFETTPVFIDFYIEVPVITHDLLSTENYGNITLMNIYNKLLYKCLGKNKNNCNWPIRVHTIDNRILVNHKKYKQLLLSDIHTQLSQEYYYRTYLNIPTHDIKLFITKFYKEIYELSRIRSETQLYRYFWKKIISDQLIQKQINKSYLTYNQIKKIYLSHVKINLELDLDIPKNFDYKDFGNWFYLLKSFNYFNNLKTMNIIINIIKVFLAPIIDIYTLTRIFRSFDVPKNEQFPSQIHNIIIYAGDGHTGPLGQTLLSLGFNLTEQSKPTSRIIESCTNMTGIYQPLFK